VVPAIILAPTNVDSIQIARNAGERIKKFQTSHPAKPGMQHEIEGDRKEYRQAKPAGYYDRDHLQNLAFSKFSGAAT
jgi:hypothetical protein